MLKTMWDTYDNINNYIIAACAIKNYIEITNNKRKENDFFVLYEI